MFFENLFELILKVCYFFNGLCVMWLSIFIGSLFGKVMSDMDLLGLEVWMGILWISVYGRKMMMVSLVVN